MKYWTARAMQVADMSSGELTELQQREEKINRCLEPWEIQHLFKKRTMKDAYGIPEADHGAQERHRRRIEREVLSQGWLKGIGEFNETDLSRCHAFDSKVIDNSASIIWDYSEKKTEGRRPMTTAPVQGEW